MKSPWIVMLAALALCGVAAGVIWHASSARIADLEQEVARLKFENSQLRTDVADAREKASVLESESEQLRAARALAGARLEPAAPAASPAADQTKPKGNFISQMFKDPQMRKLLAAQQSNVLRGLYSDFLKQAHLTPDETERFYQLLQDRQMALMDAGANMMSGGQVDSKAAGAATDAADAAIKDLLGPDQYAQYQDYEKTLGARVQIQQFNQQLAGQGMPLQDYQNTALAQIMSQESAAMPNFKDNPQGLVNMTPSDLDQYSQQIDATNQRIYNRAMAVLTPPQLTAFASYQKNMAAAQLAGMKMAQQMMNSSGNQ